VQRQGLAAQHAAAHSPTPLHPLPARTHRIITLSKAGADGSAAFMSFWIALPVFWACLNAVPPYLFIHYCFSGGSSFQTAATLTRVLSRLLTLAAISLVFLTLPKWYDMQGALNMSVGFISRNRASSLGVDDSRATLMGERLQDAASLQ
jgi:hypothetical protein